MGAKISCPCFYYTDELFELVKLSNVPIDRRLFDVVCVDNGTVSNCHYNYQYVAYTACGQMNTYLNSSHFVLDIGTSQNECCSSVYSTGPQGFKVRS